MLLALWADQFDPAQWPPAPIVTPPAPKSPTNAGSGQYVSHYDDEYWQAREAHLKRFLPVEVGKHVVERFPEAEKLAKHRNEIAARLPEMPNLQALVDLGDIIIDLDLQIEKFRIKCDEEALLALLL